MSKITKKKWLKMIDNEIFKDTTKELEILKTGLSNYKATDYRMKFVQEDIIQYANINIKNIDTRYRGEVKDLLYDISFIEDNGILSIKPKEYIKRNGNIFR